MQLHTLKQMVGMFRFKCSSNKQTLFLSVDAQIRVVNNVDISRYIFQTVSCYRRLNCIFPYNLIGDQYMCFLGKELYRDRYRIARKVWIFSGITENVILPFNRAYFLINLVKDSFEWKKQQLEKMAFSTSQQLSGCREKVACVCCIDIYVSILAELLLLDR